MAAVSGTEGLVTFSGGYVAIVTSWTIDFAAQVYDTTGMGDAWDTLVAGRKAWSGSYNCVWSASVATDGKIGGAAAAATFKFADGTQAGEIAGNIIITAINYNVDISDANKVNFTFSGDGAPTVAEAT